MIGFREAGDAGGRAAPEEGSLQPLDQPGAERVEPLEPGEVDVDRARAGMPVARVLDQAFELGGALHRPGAGSQQRDVIALGSGGKRGGAHRVSPGERAAASRKP